MNIGELKELIKNIPDDVNIFIEDMEDFSTQEFDLSTYYEGDTWIDFIIPIYIKDFVYDPSVNIERLKDLENKKN